MLYVIDADKIYRSIVIETDKSGASTVVDNVDRALDELRVASAELSCGSSSCPHARDKGGQMVNGPCRCYPHDHPLRKFVSRSRLLVACPYWRTAFPRPANDANLARICSNHVPR